MATDRLDALLRRFGVTAELFHAGPLCGVNDLAPVPGRGHLHVIRRGPVEVLHPDGVRFVVDVPTLLFYPRPLAHRFVTDAAVGADMACATVMFDAGADSPLARALPDALRVPFADGARMEATVALLFAEALEPQCGRQVVVDRLFEVLLVQLLRWTMARDAAVDGLLAGLAHPRLRHALVAMHEAPARAWTLDALAAQAGLSRSRFAETFRSVVGTTPLDYLATWRVAIAQDLLRRGQPLKRVADAVGYGSPVALNRAFRARTGLGTRAWRQAQGTTPSGASAVPV